MGFLFMFDSNSIFSGIFAPVSKIAKPGSVPQKSLTPSPIKQPLVKSSSVDVSRVTARVDTGWYEKNYA